MLNPNQQRASVHKEGPLLILATAGSGKTSTITSRYIELVTSGGVKEEKILMLTFTNKAAKEMKERIQKRHPNLACPYVSTFHSLCARMMRSLASYIGLDASFSIFDNSKQDNIIKELLKEFNVDSKIVPVKAVRSCISLNKNRAVVEPSLYTCDVPDLDLEVLIKIASRYKEELKKSNALDLDDLLLSFMFLLKNSPKIREKFQSKWDYIIVDEYQDTNRVQYEIVKILCKEHGNLCVTGDVNQCLEVNQTVELLSISGEGELKKIKDLKVGDYIKTVKKGVPAYAPITKISFTKVKEVISIETETGLKNIVSTNHEYFIDTKSRLPSGRSYIFLHYSEKAGFWLSKFRSIIGWDINRFRRSTKTEKLWILSSSDSVDNIDRELKFLSLKYNLLVLSSKDYRADNMDKYIRLINRESLVKGRQILQDFRMSEDRPVSKPIIKKQDRNITTLIFNGDVKSFKLKIFGKNKRPEFKNFDSISKANSYISKAIKYNPNARVEQKMIFQDKRHLHPVEALQVEEGCLLPVIKNEEYMVLDKVKSATLLKGDYEVADIEIGGTGLIVVDNIVSHNSIYRFRASDYRIILQFMEDFPEAERIDLDVNYRSVPEIVEISNKLIKNNTHRFDTSAVAARDSISGAVQLRNYDNNFEEADNIVRVISEMLRTHKNYSYKSFSILCRTNAQMLAIEQGLTRARMPYSLSGGLHFFDRKEIKTLVAYLNIINNPKDYVSLKYCINEPKRGIGVKSVEKMIDAATALNTSIASFMEDYIDASGGLGLSGSTYTKVADFYRMLLGIDKNLPVKEVIQRLLKEAGLEEAYMKESLKAESDGVYSNRLEYVKQLMELCDVIERETGENTIQSFLSYVSLFSNGDDMHNDDKVKVMTIHASKGLEFPVVFVPGLIEGVLPHMRSVTLEEIEEERRLLYVALTRGQDRLHISTVSYFNAFGSESRATESRFIKELNSRGV